MVARGVMHSSSLIHLDLRSTAFRKEGADCLFEALEENETVNCLQIGNLKGLNRNMLGGKGIAGIEKYLKTTSILTFLNLNNAGIGHEGLSYLLKGLKACTSVRVLDIGLNSLETKSSSLVLEIMLKTRIKRLNLGNNQLGNGFVVVFHQCVKDIHFTLTHLSLSACGFACSGLEFLFGALKRGTTLEHLELDGLKCDDDSFKKLAQFISAAMLKSFSSANSMFGDKGIGVVSEGFANNYSLEVINFSGNRISNKGAITLCKNFLQMKSKRLKSINLSHNLIEVLRIVAD
eukprot:TRINITY_DN10701_c0_g3_i2.p1 TRINITY_DN10701_c0_g3~~TRINITY_DN10701_c0_g3_i2.p1  ORF type:complete len:290 (-),score=49.82 TRINITY_DN10701_c0_g3_i2:152-1021(-)